MAIAVFFDYITWLYSGGVKEYFRAWFNFHWFLFHFFSTDLMLSRLFSPWHRMREGRSSRGLDIEDFFSRLAVNLILRTVGFVVRAIFILISLTAQAALLAAGLAVFIIFLLSPAAIPVLFLTGMFFLL